MPPVTCGIVVRPLPVTGIKPLTCGNADRAIRGARRESGHMGGVARPDSLGARASPQRRLPVTNGCHKIAPLRHFCDTRL